MYQVLKENPDLIVLDDPISSFDKNKKFAILDALFRGENSFSGKTVLLMTHDLEPIIDMVLNLAPKFKNPAASFLSMSNGEITEIPITKEDLTTFPKICDEILNSNSEDIIKLIYLRRKFEVMGKKGAPYQLISNLLHRRRPAIWKDGLDTRDMTVGEIDDASSQIGRLMPDFNYVNLLSQLNDHDYMLYLYSTAANNYEKLQIYRIISSNGDLNTNDVVAKFIDEVFHIENEYLIQLNPRKYQTVPNYIIEECNRLLGILHT